MPFTLTPGVHPDYDEEHRVRGLEHIWEPFYPSSPSAMSSARTLAAEYLREAAGIYEIDPAALEELESPVEDEPRIDLNRPNQLRFAAESALAGAPTAISFVQMYMGLPIWEAGVTVTVLSDPLRVVSSRSTFHHEVELANLPSPETEELKVTPALLRQALRIRGQRQSVSVTGTRMLVYRYEAPKRSGRADRLSGVQQEPPLLPAPSVPRTVMPGVHYLVVEIFFALAMPDAGDVPWRAFMEPHTRAILFLQSGRADCTGQVYLQDPPTGGNAGATPASPAATLDPLRTTVPLQGLTAANPQSLTGQWVTVAARGTTPAPPTTPSPPCDFSGASYSVPSTNFAAVNAYHHLDELYRLIESWGFSPVTTFFSGTSFPVTAYYFDEGATVNAHAVANPTFTGLSGYTFGSEDGGATVGIAVDWRIVIHEFNHHMLLDRVHNYKYGFAHNGGDAFAAVYFDPDSSAPDKGLNFPWCSAIPRRNDRPVATWAWGGVNDDTDYSSEEILSTCLMRLYKATGGDAADVNARRLASRHVLYVKVHADASLGPSPITPTATADPYVTALINADAAITSFQAIPGGTIGKVARWAFEKQGLYQPAGTPWPVTSPGRPPPVDVYIDDGRGGEYPYQEVFWENTDIWNRRMADGGTAHEEPIVNVTNYVYVRIKNRGTQQATNVVVSGYHCRPSTGLAWPDDWEAMTTAQLTVSGSILSGGSVVVGPFSWTPTELGHECILMAVSATGDLSNVDAAASLPCGIGPTPIWHLVPFDNNLGQRNVAPVAGAGGAAGLSASMNLRPFWANNPYDHAARVTLEAELPTLLSERGWELRFVSPGGAAFTLGPRASRRVLLKLSAGGEFSPSIVRKAGSSAVIRVRAVIDGCVVGGMSYAIDPTLKRPSERPPKYANEGAKELAAELLQALDLPAGGVDSTRIKRVTIEIDFES
jgi:hypothetical protein